MWRRQCKFYSPLELSSFYPIAINEGGAGTYGAGRIMQNVSESTIHYSSVNAGYCGAQFTDLDKPLLGILQLPRHVDTNFPIRLKVNWTGNNSGAITTGVLWTVLYDLIKKDVAINNAPSTPLSTPIVASLGNLPWSYSWSDYGVISNLGLTNQELDDGANLVVQINNTLVDANISSLIFLGIEIDYLPIMCLLESDFIAGRGEKYDPAFVGPS